MQRLRYDGCPFHSGAVRQCSRSLLSKSSNINLRPTVQVTHSQLDFIAAIYEGVVFFVEGSAKGWKEPRRITDSQGRNVVLSLYYDRENNEDKNANRAPKGQKDPGDHCVSASLFDWDGDGDLDLLLGAYKGALYRQMNEGKKGQPRFTGINIPVYAGNALSR